MPRASIKYRTRSAQHSKTLARPALTKSLPGEMAQKIKCIRMLSFRFREVLKTAHFWDDSHRACGAWSTRLGFRPPAPFRPATQEFGQLCHHSRYRRIGDCRIAGKVLPGSAVDDILDSPLAIPMPVAWRTRDHVAHQSCERRTDPIATRISPVAMGSPLPGKLTVHSAPSGASRLAQCLRRLGREQHKGRSRQTSRLSYRNYRQFPSLTPV